MLYHAVRGAPTNRNVGLPTNSHALLGVEKQSFIGGISMNFATNIHHEIGHC